MIVNNLLLYKGMPLYPGGSYIILRISYIIYIFELIY
jgi:hypothetical protein